MSYSTEHYANLVLVRWEGALRLVSNYAGSRRKITLECTFCGSRFRKRADNAITNHPGQCACPTCKRAGTWVDPQHAEVS